MRPGGRPSSTVQVRVGGSHDSVAESNCVTARWGGEQLNANDRSVGDEPVSVGTRGEPSDWWRSLKITAHAGFGVNAKAMRRRCSCLGTERSEARARKPGRAGRGAKVPGPAVRALIGPQAAGQEALGSKTGSREGGQEGG